MKGITISVAPQAYISDYLYEKWMIDHTGTVDDFYSFLTSPSGERTEFLESLQRDILIEEGLGFTTYSNL